MVDLNRGADEETREGDDWEAESFDEVLANESLTRLEYNHNESKHTDIGIVVLRQNVKIPLIYSWLDIVKFTDVCMLHPIH